MSTILRGANGRRHEVDFNDDPVIVDVAMNAVTVQTTMTAADPGDPAAIRDALFAGNPISEVVAAFGVTRPPPSIADLGQGTNRSPLRRPALRCRRREIRRNLAAIGKILSSYREADMLKRLGHRGNFVISAAGIY